MPPPRGVDDGQEALGIVGHSRMKGAGERIREWGGDDKSERETSPLLLRRLRFHDFDHGGSIKVPPSGEKMLLSP